MGIIQFKDLTLQLHVVVMISNILYSKREKEQEKKERKPCIFSNKLRSRDKNLYFSNILYEAYNVADSLKTVINTESDNLSTTFYYSFISNYFYKDKEINNLIQDL